MIKLCTKFLDIPTVKEVFSTRVFTWRQGDQVSLWKTRITPSE